MAFYQVRSLFAQIVEGIILLDRLVHILQQVSDLIAVKVILDLDSAVKEVNTVSVMVLGIFLKF